MLRKPCISKLLNKWLQQPWWVISMHTLLVRLTIFWNKIYLYFDSNLKLYFIKHSFLVAEYNRTNCSPNHRGYNSNTSTPQSQNSLGSSSGGGGLVPLPSINGSSNGIGSNSSLTEPTNVSSNGQNLSLSLNLSSPGVTLSATAAVAAVGAPVSVAGGAHIKYEPMSSYHANVPSPNLLRSANSANVYSITPGGNMPSPPGIFNGELDQFSIDSFNFLIKYSS